MQNFIGMGENSVVTSFSGNVRYVDTGLGKMFVGNDPVCEMSWPEWLGEGELWERKNPTTSHPWSGEWKQWRGHWWRMVEKH